MADNDRKKRSNSHSRRNKGISPVLGTIIFVLVAVAAIGTISFIFMAQDNYNTAVKKSTELVGNKGKEQISVVQLEETKLQIANDGSATSRIIGLVSADDSTGNLSLEPLSLALSSSQKLDYAIPDGISGSVSGSGKMGLLTSLGNVFWVNTKPLQSKPLPDFAIAIAPDSLTVEQGKTGTASITTTPLNGFSDTVFLSASGLPQGTSYLIKPSSGKPTFTSTLTLTASQSATTRTFTVTISGTGTDGKTKATTLTLTIPKQTTYQLSVAIKDQFNSPVKGITVTVDSSSSYTTDANGQISIQVSQGTHTIAVPSSYLQSSGTRYVFEKWSDGGGITANPRTVTVNSAVTFTAIEKKQHYLTMQVSSSSSAGTTSPSSDWYDSGKQVTISASAASSRYRFDKWSGSGSGSYSGTANPATVTVNAPITETGGFQQVYTISVKTLATCGGLSTSPLSGLKVKIGTTTIQTDSSGVAVFTLAAGSYQASVVDTSTTKSISSVDVRGFAFKWWDNLSTSNPRTISVNGPSTLVAYYPITWQQHTLNTNTYTAEVADPSQTDSLGNPVLRSVSLPYAKSASNWLLGWEWSMDVRTDSKGAYYGAHDYAAWGYTKAFTTKWNSKLTPATHAYAVDKLAISYA
jgi:flagellin-like protein